MNKEEALGKLKSIFSTPPAIHKRYTEPEWMIDFDSNITKRVEDLVNCQLHFEYFLTGWFKTVDEHEPNKAAKLIPYKDYLVVLSRIFSAKDEEGKPLFPKIVVIKSRQIMVSWLMMAYLTWDALYTQGRKHIVQSESATSSDALLKRAYNSYQNLSSHIRRGRFLNPDRARKDVELMGLKMYNRMIFTRPEIPACELIGLTKGSDAIQQYTASIAYEDEFQKQRKKAGGGGCYSIIEAVSPAIDGGGQLICTGTVPDVPNDEWEKIARYYKDRHEAIPLIEGMFAWVNDDGILVIQVHYSADPAKNPKTKEGAAWLLKNKPGPGASQEEKDAWERQREINWTARTVGVKFPEFQQFYGDYVDPVVEYAPAYPVICGWDFGLSPSSNVCIASQLIPYGDIVILQIIDSWIQEGVRSETFIDRVLLERSKKYFPINSNLKKKFYDFIDSSSSYYDRRGDNEYIIFCKRKLYPSYHKMYDPEKEGSVRKVLEKKQVWLKIHPRNNILIEALAKRVINKNGKIFAHNPWNDAFDGFCYILGGVFDFERKINPQYLKTELENY